MNYFGDSAGKDRSARTSSSSRKGKKSSADKPKQPQRGLGVAQLEKIRLHSQLAFHPNDHIHPQIMMSEPERSNMAYLQSQPSSDPRWNASNTMFEAEQHANPGITMHLFQVQVEDSMRKKKWSNSMGTSSHNSDSIDSQELDLELRL